MVIDYICLGATATVIAGGTYFALDAAYSIYLNFWHGVSKSTKVFGPYSKTIKDCAMQECLEDIATA